MPRRLTKLRVALFIVVSGALAFVGVTWPRGGQLSEPTCSPSGLIAQISAAIHGNNFWETQLADIRTRRISAENWDRDQAAIQVTVASIMAQTDVLVATNNAWLEEIYRKYPDMSPTAAQRQAAQLRKAADEIEQADEQRIINGMMRRWAVALQRCETVVLSRVR